MPCHAEISPSLRVGFPREMVGLWQLYPEILAYVWEGWSGGTLGKVKTAEDAGGWRGGGEHNSFTAIRMSHLGCLVHIVTP